jgi:flavin-binding protein dodecin
MWKKRAEDLLAAFVIGNGILDLIAPQRRVFLWVFGPEHLRKLILWFADHPTAMRLRGIARVGIGIGLALRQYREAPRPPWYKRWFSQYRFAGWLAPLGFLVLILLTVFYRRRRRRRREAGPKKEKPMPIARVIELSATSEESFEDAINLGIKRAMSTLRNVQSAWIKDMNVLIENNQVVAYKVNMAITFVLEEGEHTG